ncbi:hypothetical protein [Microbacterium sp. MYb64]|uniref:hypothetical protein n=1 Tax=Microbacterium sp. MYb64 TaxID=1848691 RepID=UPI0011B0C769|nr:hypothetical protein [Microbacterium sp. MYb64]
MRASGPPTLTGLALALTAGFALLLSGCASTTGAHAGAPSSSGAHPSSHPTPTSSAGAPADDDDDDPDDEGDADADDDTDPDDTDPDDDADPDDDDMKRLGVGRDDLDGIDDPADRKDFLDDARRAASPAGIAAQCVAVHPRLDDIIAAGFGGLGVDELAAARSSGSGGYYIAVDLEDGRIAVLYTALSPHSATFEDHLYAVDDTALALSTFDDVTSIGDFAGDDGIARAARCL